LLPVLGRVLALFFGMLGASAEAQISKFPENMQDFHKTCLLNMLRSKTPRVKMSSAYPIENGMFAQFLRRSTQSIIGQVT
jgi:hypothetical protein